MFPFDWDGGAKTAIFLLADQRNSRIRKRFKRFAFSSNIITFFFSLNKTMADKANNNIPPAAPEAAAAAVAAAAAPKV